MTVRAVQLRLGPTIFSVPLSHVSPASAGRKTKRTAARKHRTSSATGPKSAVWKSDPIKFSSKQAEGFFFLLLLFFPSRRHRSAGLTVSSVEYFGPLA